MVAGRRCSRGERTAALLGSLLALALVGCGQTEQSPGPSVATAGAGPATAGSGPGTPGDGTASSPRLLPWQLRAPDAPPLVVGIFDSLRGVNCEFLPDSAGQVRCLPLAPPTLEPTSSFADASCAQPIYRVSHTTDLTELLGREVAVPLPPMGCEQRYAVGTLRAQADSAQRFGGTVCVPVQHVEPPEGAHDLVLSGPSAPERWVAGEERDGPLLGDRLRVAQWTTAVDGTFDARLLDGELSEPCRLVDVDERLVCAPHMLPRTSSFYVDSGCGGAMLWQPEECEQSSFIGSVDDLYRTGAEWQGEVFVQGKTCQTLEATYDMPPATKFFERGEAVGLDALASAIWTSSGSGRLLLRGLADEQDAFVALGDQLFDGSSVRRAPGENRLPRYHDVAAGSDCSPVWTRDAGVRCVPQTTDIDPFRYDYVFADSGCSVPAYLCLEDDCLERELVVMAYDERGDYRAVSRNLAVDLSSEPTYYLTGKKCVDSGALGLLMIKAGESLPWDDYPELAEENGRAGAP